MRTAHTEPEWQEAADVVVQLAGNYKLMMKITEAGTLLMPYKQLHASLEDRAVAAQTIVPMGQLIQSLGYSMVWNPNECYLQSPEGDRIQMQLDGGCPQLREMEALALIARLEDQRLEELNNATLTTRDKLQVSAMSMERSWDFYLMDYVMTGSFESGLRAVRDAPFFADLPESTWRMSYRADPYPIAVVWMGHNEGARMLHKAPAEEDTPGEEVDSPLVCGKGGTLGDHEVGPRRHRGAGVRH